MDVTTLETKTRDTRGKNAARRLRREGLMPGVLYGTEEASRSEGVALSVDPKSLARILHSESGVNTIIELQMEGRSNERVLVKDFQLDPVSHDLLHVDFYRFAMDKPIVVTVQVQVQGEPRGVKQQGGLLDFVTREIELECLPVDIPEHIDIDVSELMLGEAVRLRDILEGQKWTPLTDPDTMIVHVVPPRVEEKTEEEVAAEEAAAAGETPGEPEVIKKGKDEDEGGEKA